MHLTDIFQAYFDCRRRKRRTREALLWEEHFEENCLQLYEEIIDGKCQPDPYKLIYVTDPVMREIFVPTFRDRVVHHLLANWLRPKLESFFIHDNYAGREGRGTLFGIRRAEKFMRQVTYNYQKPAYVLKLDIASYFRNIPKERLWGNLQKILFPSFQPSPEFTEGREVESIPDDPLCTFYAKSTKSIQETKTRYRQSSSENLFASRSNSCSPKNLFLNFQKGKTVEYFL